MTPRPARRWQAVLPSLRPTLDPHPTLVPVLALPDVAGTRSLMRELPALVHRRPVRSVKSVRSGRVIGMVELVEPAPAVDRWSEPVEPVRIEPAEPPMPVEQAEPVELPEQLVLPRPRYSALPARMPAQPLIEARAEYVAEPVAPEQPFRGVTEIERLAAQYEEMGLGAAMGLLGMTDGPSVAVPPPVPVREPEPVRSSMPAQRRPSLAQSRRLGIRVARVEPDTDPPSPVRAEPEPVPSAEQVTTTPVTTTVEPVTAVEPIVVERAEPSVLAHRTSEPPVEPPSPTTVDDPVQRTVAAPLWPRPRAKTETTRPPVVEAMPSAPAAPEQPIPDRPPPEQPLPIVVAPEPEPASPEPEPVSDMPLVHLRSVPDEPAPSDETLPAISGPVYRAVLDDRAPAPPPVESMSDPVVVPVPDDLTVLFRQQLGVDIAPIPVHRGRAVTQRAAELGARAFTHGGEVFLPDRVGPLTERPVRALLAHELAHAVQQRVLGATQPSPESADGRELEDAAHAVEQWVAGDGAAPPSLVHRSAGPVSSTPTFLPAAVTQLAEGTVITEPSSAPTSWTLQNGFATGPPPATEPLSPAEPTPGADPAPQVAPDVGPGPSFPWIAPRPAAPDHEVGAAMATAFQQIADLRESVAGLRARHDEREEPRTIDLSEVAGRIYEYVRSRLRAELIVDRERAGLLADIG